MRLIGHSQNFIRNQAVLESLIRNSTITKKDLVIEIGAGSGEITKQLSQHAKEVIAIEKDKKLHKKLVNNLGGQTNIRILNTDIFEFRFPISKSYKVFSNIPFNYTADIVRLLTEQPNQAEDIYLFMQQQAAFNYIGKPEAKESLKSLFTKIFFKPLIIHQFHRNDFRPIPYIKIVLLRLQKLSEPLLVGAKVDRWKDFVVYAFSQTKPNLQEGLKRIFTIQQFNQITKDFKIQFQNTPKDLTLKQWLDLYDFFDKKIDQQRKSFVHNSYQMLQSQQQSLCKIHRTRIDRDWKKR